MNVVKASQAARDALKQSQWPHYLNLTYIIRS